MSQGSLYNELIDATVAHLEELKERGIRYVSVSPEHLEAPGHVATPVQRQPRPAASLQRPARPASTPSATPTPASVPARAAADPITLTPGLSKAQALEELRQRAAVCQKCSNLASARKNVVFGVGNPEADLMFVGEAPGADEDIQGEPFVGKAGQLLTKIIQTMGLNREKVYIANILKCRPDTPGQSFGNRPPTPDEMDRCLPYLHAQIDVIKPKVIVALGATAVNGLFGATPGAGITKLRGSWREYRGIPVMLTYHPSYLLRPNVNNIKRETWEDMLHVMERLQMPISEKQRGYFLKTQ